MKNSVKGTNVNYLLKRNTIDDSVSEDSAALFINVFSLQKSSVAEGRKINYAMYIDRLCKLYNVQYVGVYSRANAKNASFQRMLNSIGCHTVFLRDYEAVMYFDMGYLCDKVKTVIIGSNAFGLYDVIKGLNKIGTKIHVCCNKVPQIMGALCSVVEPVPEECVYDNSSELPSEGDTDS